MKDTKQITRQTARILGTEIEISDDAELEHDGVYYPYRREIHLRPEQDMLDNTAREYEKAIRYNEVKRHELIHAFFDIAGLETYSADETLVDFLAAMFPRMTQVLKDTGCNY